MRTLNSHTGYLIVDHSNSPGISIDELPDRLKSTAVIAGAGEIVEFDTKSCSHCERQVYFNPGRVRDRGICYHCHHYICDSCNEIYRKTRLCVPFKAVLDKLFNHNVKNPDNPLVIIPGA